MNGWKLEALGVFAGDEHFCIDGVPVWSVPWKLWDGPAVRFRDPVHGTLLKFDVYTLEGMQHVRFAARELSNTIWGFLTPD